MNTKVYKNGDVCLVIRQDCFDCGERDWVDVKSATLKSE